MTNSAKIISLCKRRGFVFPSSEIYGGLASVYDYGPLGALMLKNIRNLWWSTFIDRKLNVVGIESQILMHPTVWKASGHVDGFSDPLVDCKKCKNRFRADHVISNILPDIDPDAYDNDGLHQLMIENRIKCPTCGEFDWSNVRNFNLLMETHLGVLSGEKDLVYLRGETAQGMYVLFKDVMETQRLKIPFGIAQIGKVFRNEITKGKFIFRTLEFEQMELQYFVKEKDWQKAWDEWRIEIENWYNNILGIDRSKFKWKPHHPDKMAHYAKKAEDYTYEFDWGFDEVSGLHYRTDFDLNTHQKHSGKDLSIFDDSLNDENSTKSPEKYLPHVVESTWGLNRNLLMLLQDAYVEEEDRIVLKLDPKVAPYQLAVFPLVKNKPELMDKAKIVFQQLLDKGFRVTFDDRGNIGKRYYSQDEIGTFKCVTVDYQTLEDQTVTVRDRDTKIQNRCKVEEIKL